MKSKRTKNTLEFQRLVREFLDEIAKRPAKRELYSYAVQTVAGRLLIEPYERWVACRFDDPAAAAACPRLLGPDVNEWSGKWNHVYSSPGLREFSDFKARLLNILPEQLQ